MKTHNKARIKRQEQSQNIQDKKGKASRTKTKDKAPRRKDKVLSNGKAKRQEL